MCIGESTHDAWQGSPECVHGEFSLTAKRAQYVRTFCDGPSGCRASELRGQPRASGRQPYLGAPVPNGGTGTPERVRPAAEEIFNKDLQDAAPNACDWKECSSTTGLAWLFLPFVACFPLDGSVIGPMAGC